MNEEIQQSASVAEAKINEYKGKVDGFVEKILGIVGDHPWETWLAGLNAFITKFMPAVIAVAALIGCIAGLIITIKEDAPFSMVIANLWILVLGVFSMHLAPKALALPRSFIEKNELEAVRPELLYILKVILGLGGLVLSAYLLLQFSFDAFKLAIIALISSILSIIVLSRPEIIGVKPGYPTNCVEEAITLIMLPVRFVLSMMTLLVSIATVVGLIYGLIAIFNNGLTATLYLDVTTVLPLVVPLAVYFAYLFAMFVLDFYRAVVSVPRKLDELKKA